MSLAQPATSDDLHPGTTPGISSPVRDPIVEEVRAARDAYARSFDYDPAAIIADLRAREAQHPEQLVSLSPKRLPK